MGDILRFEPEGGRRKKPSSPPSSEGAAILFFLGVRYERWDEAEPKTPVAKNRRAVRKATRDPHRSEPKRRA